MTKQKLWIILGLLAVLILIVFSLNFYFVSYLNANQSGPGEGHGKMASTKTGYLHQLKKRVRSLKPIYLNRNPQYYRIRNKVWQNFEPKAYDNVSLIWDISYWVSVNYKKRKSQRNRKKYQFNCFQINF